MERLDKVKFDSNKYIWNEDNPEFDDAIQNCVYPISIIDKIDIKEGKLSIFDYLRKISQGALLFNPEIQPNRVWKPIEKSFFLESVILNIPIPHLYFKRDNYGNLIILDGVQRTNAILEFMDNDLILTGLKTIPELNGQNYNTLINNPDNAKLISKIEDRQLKYYELSAKTPMSIVYDIFNRINSSEQKLERQEIRNRIFIGKVTDLLKDLASNPIFQKAIDNGIPSSRMKDREAILRCLAFTINDLDSFKGSMDEFLESTMRKINRISVEEIKKLSATFLKVINTTYEIFEKNNFRIPDKERRGSINIALMECLYYVFHNLILKGKNIEKEKMKEAYNRLISSKTFLDSVRNNTASIQSVYIRFHMAKKEFSLL